jgi:arsenate reductase-like glutaredoxin family protein
MDPLSPLIVYGIANCDKVRAVLKWCQQRQLPCQLHDYRRDGLPDTLLGELLSQFPLEQLVNKRSTSWRQLDAEEKQALGPEVLKAHPTLIKRPIVRAGNRWLLAATTAQLEKQLA